ncbi:Atu4866 domain-containing protein [Oceanibaculum pacificum]|uniref:Agrobacterium tumefaciens protein Atu4866 n=1 Tax=Oceanibaculum pacificum TaxID=580166 RepID=A0A154VI76_9PROT|nr:Atu4866 domain-containing protein [Oceanibaculum pacificum]KZD01043.1 hypothetical protein AUP43_03645 [Oceanibaculum pacificum]
MLRLQIIAVALLATVPGALAAPQSLAQGSASQSEQTAHPYTGMWVTADGHIRHELLPNGRYDEARGNRVSAYQGRYTVTGNRIEYVDDTGFTADGTFIDDVLYHGGMVLRRETASRNKSD